MLIIIFVACMKTAKVSRTSNLVLIRDFRYTCNFHSSSNIFLFLAVKFTTELPKIIRANQSTREVEISCKVDTEDAEIFWKKDGKRIGTLGGRYCAISEGLNRILKINEPRPVHSGIYSAVAGNKFTNCEVFIESKEMMLCIYFV